MTLPNRRGYKPPVRGTSRSANADNADGESKHPQSSTAAGPTVYSSDSRGDGGTSDAVAAARDALAATKRRAAAKRGAVEKRSKVPKGKAKGKGKSKAKSRPSKRKGGASKATEVTSVPQLTVAPEIVAAISERLAEDSQAFASEKNLVRRHTLFPALAHTGSENAKTGIDAKYGVGDLFSVEKAKAAGDGSGSTSNHTLGKHPDLDDFLINWIRLLEAYQIEMAGAVEAAHSQLDEVARPSLTKGALEVLSEGARQAFPRAVAPYRGPREQAASAALGLGADSAALQRLLADAMADLARDGGNAGTAQTLQALGLTAADGSSVLGQASAGRGRRTRPKLSEAAVWNMKRWMLEHFTHPYPSVPEKRQLAAENNLTVPQVANWFTNARKRIWQPIVKGETPVTDLYAALFGKRSKGKPGDADADGEGRGDAAPDLSRRLTQQQAIAAGFAAPENVSSATIGNDEGGQALDEAVAAAAAAAARSGPEVAHDSEPPRAAVHISVVANPPEPPSQLPEGTGVAPKRSLTPAVAPPTAVENPAASTGGAGRVTESKTGPSEGSRKRGRAAATRASQADKSADTAGNAGEASPALGRQIGGVSTSSAATAKGKRSAEQPAPSKKARKG